MQYSGYFTYIPAPSIMVGGNHFYKRWVYRKIKLASYIQEIGTKGHMKEIYRDEITCILHFINSTFTIFRTQVITVLFT